MSQKLIDKTLNLLLFSIIAMIITGGGILRLGKVKIEFASVNAWAAAFLLLSFFAIKIRNFDHLKSIQRLTKILNLLQKKELFWGLLSFFGITLLFAHLFRHWSLNTDGADVSFVHQSLNYLFAPTSMKCDLCLKQSFLGEHTAFTFYLLGFFTWLKSDELIIFFEICFILSSLLIFFYLGPLKNKKNRWAIMLIFIFGHVTLKNGLIWDFREDHLGLGFLLIFLTLFFNKYYKTAVLFFFLTVLSKENFAFITIVFPLVIWFEKDFELTKKQKIGWSIFYSFLSLIWIMITFKLILPHFNAGVENGNNIVSRFPGLGSTPNEVLINLIIKPKLLISLLAERFIHPSTFKYLGTLLLPFLFIIYKRWWWIVAATPVLMMNLLSWNYDQRMLIFHYDLMLFPFIIFALALEFDKIEINSYKFINYLLIMLCFSGKWPGFYVTKYWPNLSDLKNITFFNTIPNSGILGTNQRLMAQTSHLYEQRRLRTPNFSLLSSSEENWIKFWEYNRRLDYPRDRIADDVNFLLLDKEIPWENFLLGKAQEKGWKLLSQSPENRFYYLQKI